MKAFMIAIDIDIKVKVKVKVNTDISDGNFMQINGIEGPDPFISYHIMSFCAMVTHDGRRSWSLILPIS